MGFRSYDFDDKLKISILSSSCVPSFKSFNFGSDFRFCTDEYMDIWISGTTMGTRSIYSEQFNYSTLI